MFADRSYQSDGALTPRSKPGALIEDPDKAVLQALRMVRQSQVFSVDGKTIELKADTLCLHGDGTHALEFAVAIRSAFEQNGIVMKAP